MGHDAEADRVEVGDEDDEDNETEDEEEDENEDEGEDDGNTGAAVVSEAIVAVARAGFSDDDTADAEDGVGEENRSE